jgi:ubiquinone/menaquinone biosynthesis C-methylase UbiE
MSLPWKLLRLAFHLLYHPFAWTYDWVAATVSLGRWTGWVQTVIPFIEGGRILELGHGPGHLQRFLLERSLLPYGLDESAPMGRLARRNLRKSGFTQIRLTRGLAQSLPFPCGWFETVAATFPSEYIFDPRTLSEIQRVLAPGGRLVTLPMAWITGRSLPDRFFAWLFRVTGQTIDLSAEMQKRFLSPFEGTGFSVETREVQLKSSQVFIIIARKTTSE